MVPVLPEAAWRLFLTRRFERVAKRSVGDDPVRGLALYRSNFLAARTWPAAARVTMPVQVVVPAKDPFLSPDLVEGLDAWVADLTVVRVDSGHWWPATRPAEFAQVIRNGDARR
jgi:pimeloyl-ACP methyl ester carboxylesterase